MKIAVSARENSLDSAFEFRFSRAPGFVLFDTDTLTLNFINNWSSQRPVQNSEVQLIQCISAHGVQAIITGSIGPKANQALAGSGMLIYPFRGETVREAIRAYQQGQLDHVRISKDRSSPAVSLNGTGGRVPNY